jgi:hypothetical protein
MDAVKRIVTLIPLDEIWNDDGPLDARRAEEVGEVDAARLLKAGSSLLVADVGRSLEWIFGDDRFAFWKSEVKGRLVNPEVGDFRLEDYPGNYCYVATMWKSSSVSPIVVLERHH